MEDKQERLIVSEETQEERQQNVSLRPTSLAEFLGQPHTIDSLKIAIQAATKRKEPLEHILLSGPPGLGKTSLAACIAHEMKAEFFSTSGPAIERAGDLVGILTNVKEGDILFIDEIHRLSKVIEEFLYPAIENFQIDFVIDKGPYAKSIKIPLKPFTLIGATTRKGLLSSPLRSRFGIFYNFDFYQPEELGEIIRKSSQRLSLTIDEASIAEIARRARGTPRIANRIFKRVRDYAEVKTQGVITRELTIEALDHLRIDEYGLDDLDRRYLRSLVDFYKGGPVGIESLSASLGEEKDVLMDVVEPFLIKLGFIKRTPKGRVATEQVFKHMEMDTRRQKQQRFL